MFNMSKEEKFNFDIANLKQDFAIENMNITDSDIEILKKYSNDRKKPWIIAIDNINESLVRFFFLAHKYKPRYDAYFIIIMITSIFRT